MEKFTSKSGKQDKFKTNLKIKDVDYYIHTEDAADNNPFIRTYVYLNGAVVDTVKMPYPVNEMKKDEIEKVMSKQHNEMIEKMKAKHVDVQKERNDYVREIKRFIARNRLKDALNLADDGMIVYPDDPFIMSYQGYLKVAIKKQYKEGIDTCKKALKILRNRMPVGRESYYPMFYLNLGKIYVLYGRKDMAHNYFSKGLQYEKGNKELLDELIKLGIRKRPPIPFLPRSNFVNKYIGMVLSKVGLK